MWKKLFGKPSGDSHSNEDKPVHTAASEGVEALQTVLDRSPAQRDEPGWFSRHPIHVAAEAGQVRCVNLLQNYKDFCDLPDDYFVFGERDGYYWVFFIADGVDDDPPVFSFTDGEDLSYEQIARSVWEFIESLVIDYELWSESDAL